MKIPELNLSAKFTEPFKSTQETLQQECNNIEETTVDKLTYNLEILPSDLIVGKDVFTDIEIFEVYNNCDNTDDTVFNMFKKNCDTTGGQIFVKNLLKNPIYDIEILKKRVHLIDFINSNDIVEENKPSKHLENDFLWFFSQNDQTVSELLEGVYFSTWFLKNLNNNDKALTLYNLYKMVLSPLFGIITPIIYFVIPFLVVKYKFGDKVQLSFYNYIKLIYKSMSSSANVLKMFDSDNGLLSKAQTVSYVLSFFFYFQGLFNTFSLSKSTHSIVKYINDKVNNNFIFLKRCVNIVDTYWTNVSLQQGCFLKKNIPILDENILTSIREYEPYIKFSICSNFGKQLQFYKQFPKEELLKIVNVAYFIDGLRSIGRLKYHIGLSFPNYIKFDETPIYESIKAWHICLDPNTTVRNDITFKNAVITGPNAGGKSTLIKTMCINILLAQTCCVTASENTKITPFYFINSQINVPDCKGIESLFEAEMNRCMYTLDTVRKYPDKPCLIIMDEIFNSTNVVEAIAGAFSILENLASHKNVMTTITTHFLYLTKLKKQSSFECFCMNVKIDEYTNDIVYPYKLKTGISKQYVALELLKKRGFEKSIVDNALILKQKLLSK
jgi:hypothetical protein